MKLKSFFTIAKNDYISGADICLLLFPECVGEDDDYEKLLW